MRGDKIFGLFTVVFGANLDDKSRDGKRWEGTVKKISFSEWNQIEGVYTLHLLLNDGLEPSS